MIKFIFITLVCLQSHTLFAARSSLIIKMNSNDCASCFVALGELNSLHEHLELKILFDKKENYLSTAAKIEKIISRKKEFLISDSLYNQLQLDRTSYFLLDTQGVIITFGQLYEIKVPELNFLSISIANNPPRIIRQLETGRSEISQTNNEDLVVLNKDRNTISFIYKRDSSALQLSSKQIGRELIYSAMHANDTSQYWLRVKRKEQKLRAYGMYDLKFESVTVVKDSCFVLSTIYEVAQVKTLNGFDDVYTPFLLVVAFHSHSPNKLQLRKINPLPKKAQAVYGLDNTQKMYIAHSSQELLVGVYKDHLRGKRRIFAKYHLANGQYEFNEFGRHQLPKTFKKDGLVYEGNLYDIKEGLLVYLQTGDFIALSSSQKGNFDLGKTVLVKKYNNYDVKEYWFLEGYQMFNEHTLALVYYSQNKRVITLLENPYGSGKSQKYTAVLSEDLKPASNIIIRPNGSIIFVNERGECVQF